MTSDEIETARAITGRLLSGWGLLGDEDCCSAGMLGCVIAKRTHDGSSALATWMYMKARDEITRLLRSRRRIFGYSRTIDGPAGFRAAVDVEELVGDDSEPHVLRYEGAERLRAAFKLLPPREQDMLARYYTGDPMPQIADDWNLSSRGHATHVRQRAEAVLRQQMTDPSAKLYIKPMARNRPRRRTTS